MYACGKEFNDEVIARIIDTVEQEPSISRRSLSRLVCGWLDWRAPNGNMKDMSCRTALLRLHGMGLISLPAPGGKNRFVRKNSGQQPDIPEGIEKITGSVEELGRIEINPVEIGDRSASRTWNGLMEKYHYLAQVLFAALKCDISSKVPPAGGSEASYSAVQVTTTLNYSAHPATENPGPVGSSPNGPIGLIVHDTMAFNLHGTPLGLLDVQCLARNPKEFGKKKLRHSLPIEQKESYKWIESFKNVAHAQKKCPGAVFVSVGDRVADIYELLELADPSGPKLLVRSQHNRRLAKEEAYIWDKMAQEPILVEMVIRVPRRGNRPAGDAVLSIRFAEVTLKTPHNRSKKKDLTVWEVLAREPETTVSDEPIEWRLITTCEVKAPADAIEKVEWYSGRWAIEVYHKTLKSGCKIEERQLGAAERIESCLVDDMVVAWRVHHLTKLGGETPDAPCTVFLEEHE